jgi:exodeoxyribonuclease VII large subunit
VIPLSFAIDPFDDEEWNDPVVGGGGAPGEVAPLEEPRVLSVTEVSRQIKDALEGNFPVVIVRGEISNLSRAGSGHVYLTLKDDKAQLRAVMWRGVASKIRFDLRDGLEVVAAGPIEVYEARGTYQLVIHELVPQGIGALELAFRQLHEKLAKEGLFDPARKRPLPRFPRKIALITSPTGAAIRDMLQVLDRRWRGVEIVILPVPVQGADAAPKIARALRDVGRIPGVEVVIVGRGGGSLEDLWAFNEEVVARAIHACPVPVVSAVGHEIDVTIADFVADRRALTPSEAAELVVPDREEIGAALSQWDRRMSRALRTLARGAGAELEHLAARRVWTKPFDRLRQSAQTLDGLQTRGERAMRGAVERAAQRVAAMAAELQALSPLRVLERGYSVTRLESGELLNSPDQAPPGVRITTRLRGGELTSVVVPPEG